MKKLSEEEFLNLCCALDKIGEAAWSGGGGQDTSALSEAMELIKQAYVDRPMSEEISKLTNQIHALANECAMHGWDYRPLLRANELLKEAYDAEPKAHYAQLVLHIVEYDGSRKTALQRVEFIKSNKPFKAGQLMHPKFIRAFLPQFFQGSSTQIRILSISDAKFIADDSDIFFDIDAILQSIS